MDNEEKKKDGDFESKLAECENQRDEYLAGWQRAKADFINYKKDELMRIQEIARFGTEEMILELIGVLDNFDLAISYMEGKGPAPRQGLESRPEGVGVEKGIYMIRANIKDLLKKRGVEKIEIKIGAPL